MKRIIFSLMLFACFSLGYAQSLDSLKTKREQLYQQYAEISIPGKDLSEKELAKAIGILKDLIIVDTRIIKEYGGTDIQIKENAALIKDLELSVEDLKKEKDINEKLLNLMFIAGGILLVLFVISVAFLIILIMKVSKMKKKQQVYSDLLKEAEGERVRMLQMEEALAEKEKEIETFKARVKSFNTEMTLADEKMKSLEKTIGELKNQPSNLSDNIPKSEDVNFGLTKMDKLMKMKELGIVTEDEFNSFRQKFLDEK